MMAAQVHHYPLQALAPDYARAGIGLVLTGGPVLFVQPASAILYLLLGLAGLFLVFALRTLWRQIARVEVDADGIRILGPAAKRIDWEELRDVSVRYYSTRRDRSAGWMQLTVQGGGRRIVADSGITAFPALVAAALAAAGQRGIALSDSTRANASILGINWRLAAPGFAG